MDERIGCLEFYCRITASRGNGSSSRFTTEEDFRKRKYLQFHHPTTPATWRLTTAFTPSVNQTGIFETLGSAVADWTFDGFNACLLSMGLTQSGKSYSLFGQSTGLAINIILELFRRAEGSSNLSIGLSLWDIKGDVVRDGILRIRSQPSTLLQNSDGFYQFDAYRLRTPAEARSLIDAFDRLGDEGHRFVRVCLLDSTRGILSTAHFCDLKSKQPDILSLKALLENLSASARPFTKSGDVNENDVKMLEQGGPLTQLLHPLIGGNSKTYLLMHVSEETANAQLKDTLECLDLAERASLVSTICTRVPCGDICLESLPYTLRLDASPISAAAAPESTERGELEHSPRPDASCTLQHHEFPPRHRISTPEDTATATMMLPTTHTLSSATSATTLTPPAAAAAAAAYQSQNQSHQQDILRLAGRESGALGHPADRNHAFAGAASHAHAQEVHQPGLTTGAHFHDRDNDEFLPTPTQSQGGLHPSPSNAHNTNISAPPVVPDFATARKVLLSGMRHMSSPYADDERRSLANTSRSSYVAVTASPSRSSTASCPPSPTQRKQKNKDNISNPASRKGLIAKTNPTPNGNGAVRTVSFPSKTRSGVEKQQQQQQQQQQHQPLQQQQQQQRQPHHSSFNVRAHEESQHSSPGSKRDVDGTYASNAAREKAQHHDTKSTNSSTPTPRIRASHGTNAHTPKGGSGKKTNAHAQATDKREEQHAQGQHTWRVGGGDAKMGHGSGSGHNPACGSTHVLPEPVSQSAEKKLIEEMRVEKELMRVTMKEQQAMNELEIQSLRLEVHRLQSARDERSSNVPCYSGDDEEVERLHEEILHLKAKLDTRCDPKKVSAKMLTELQELRRSAAEAEKAKRIQNASRKFLNDIGQKLVKAQHIARDKTRELEKEKEKLKELEGHFTASCNELRRTENEFNLSKQLCRNMREEIAMLKDDNYQKSPRRTEEILTKFLHESTFTAVKTKLMEQFNKLLRAVDTANFGQIPVLLYKLRDELLAQLDQNEALEKKVSKLVALLHQQAAEGLRGTSLTSNSRRSSVGLSKMRSAFASLCLENPKEAEKTSRMAHAANTSMDQVSRRLNRTPSAPPAGAAGVRSGSRVPSASPTPANRSVHSIDRTPRGGFHPSCLTSSSYGPGRGRTPNKSEGGINHHHFQTPQTMTGEQFQKDKAAEQGARTSSTTPRGGQHLFTSRSHTGTAGGRDSHISAATRRQDERISHDPTVEYIKQPGAEHFPKDKADKGVRTPSTKSRSHSSSQALNPFLNGRRQMSILKESAALLAEAEREREIEVGVGT